MGLLGPNGAGKTTTFYMIVGMVKPHAGQILLGDVDLSRVPMYKRARHGIGYLAQEASIFSHLTVEGNLHAVLEFQSLDRKDEAETVFRRALAINPQLDKVRESLERLEKESANREI